MYLPRGEHANAQQPNQVLAREHLPGAAHESEAATVRASCASTPGRQRRLIQRTNRTQGQRFFFFLPATHRAANITLCKHSRSVGALHVQPGAERENNHLEARGGALVHRLPHPLRRRVREVHEHRVLRHLRREHAVHAPHRQSLAHETRGTTNKQTNKHNERDVKARG